MYTQIPNANKHKGIKFFYIPEFTNHENKKHT